MSKYPEGAKWYARKYGLTLAEASELALHPRRVELVDQHERWLERVGLPAPSSPLSRGRLLDAVRGRLGPTEWYAANPLLGVSGWWWAAGALAAAVAGYFIFRKADAPALKKATLPGSGIYGVPVVDKKAYYVNAWRKPGTDPVDVKQVPQWVRDQQKEVDKQFTIRRLQLLTDVEVITGPNHDVKPNPDKYTKERMLVFREVNAAGAGGMDKTLPWGWYPTDEFGRPYEGWGYDVNGLQMLATIAAQTLPWVPGVGTAANVALQTAIAIGQGKSFKDAALVAARAALPPPAQIAFDIGVAVASGEKPDEAAKKAVINQIPGGQAAYDQGVALAKMAKPK